MQALDWLNKHRRVLRGAFQPIEGVHFYRYHFCFRYQGLCDLALSGTLYHTPGMKTLSNIQNDGG